MDGDEKNCVNGDGDHVGNGIGDCDDNDGVDHDGVGCDDKAGESDLFLNVSCWEKKKRHVENILQRVNGMEDNFLEVCNMSFNFRTF